MQKKEDGNLAPQQNLTSASDYYLIDNAAVGRNNFVFGNLLVFQHMLICVLYGFFIEEPFRDLVSSEEFTINYSPVFEAASSYFFVLLGFGLLFSYNKKLVFSGMGFTLLVTLLSIEWYFLFNALWTKTNIQNQGTQFNPQNRYHKIYISNRDGPETYSLAGQLLINKYRATLTEAVRCGLANSIAFSCVLGRAGPLQAFFVALVGTIGYQLNRYIIGGFGLDYGYTFRLFTFAAFMGLAIALFAYFKERDPDRTTAKHPRYTANIHSSSMSLIGAAFIWVFFPTLTLDPPAQTSILALTLLERVPIHIMYGLASSTLMSISLSSFLHGKPTVRDITHGAVAGGIVVASAGFYVLNPVWAMLMGSVAGLLQCLINLVQSRYARSKQIITTISFALFGVHGLMGSLWALLQNYITRNNQLDSLFYTSEGYVLGIYQFISGLISAGMGLAFGIITGLIIFCLLHHRKQDHFYDYVYWQNDEGIHFPVAKPPPLIIAEDTMGFYEHIADVKIYNSYL